MFKSISIILFFLSFLSFTSCGPKLVVKAGKSPLQQLQADIEHLVNDPNLSNAHLGLYIAALDNPRPLYARNEHKIFVPASNLKLYTSAVALEKLGAAFRYQTKFYTRGDVSDSTLHGDLIIRGTGDPTISGRFHDKDILYDLKSWGDSLRAKGIRRIEGDIIGDNGFFSNDILAPGWEWDDETYYYTAQTSALSFNENCVDLTVEADSLAGKAVRVSIRPQTDYVKIINNARTTTGDSINTLRISRDRAQNIIRLYGNLPLGSKAEKESITVERPAEFLLRTFRHTLMGKGIQVIGNVVVQPQIGHEWYKDMNPLFVHKSPSLAEIVHETNKHSNNFYAEQLLKTMGALFKGSGSFRNGTEVVMNYLNSQGIADNELIMQDGSGLSRHNFISPASMATLLRKMAGSKNFDVFFDSLPVSGVDGTLKYRMKGMRAAGRVYAKTGYVSNVRNLSGYIKDRKGRMYIFSILVNNYSVPTSYVNDLQDKICNLISEYEGGL